LSCIGASLRALAEWGNSGSVPSELAEIEAETRVLLAAQKAEAAQLELDRAREYAAASKQRTAASGDWTADPEGEKSIQMRWK
jgi:hypothetical protein